jgi:hypothetical protein
VTIVERGPGARRRSLFGVMAAVLVTAVVAACSGSTATFPPPVGSSSAAAPTSSASPTAAEPTVEPSPTATPFPFETPAESPSLAALDHAPVLPAGGASRIDWYRGPRLDTCVEKTAADGTILNYCPEYKLFSWSRGYIIVAETDIPINDSSGELVSGELVADEYAIAIYSSSDGLHWTGPRKLSRGDVRIENIQEGPAGLLAIGYYAGPGSMGGGPDETAVRALWRSSDGVSWSPISVASMFGDAAPQIISSSPSGYIAMGGWAEPLVWTSSDGLHWAESKLPFAIYRSGWVVGSVAFAGGFVLHGLVTRPGGDGGDLVDLPAIWSSSAGSSWKLEALPGAVADAGTSAWVEKITDSRLLATETIQDATGQGSTEYDWTSTDGRTWTPFDLGPIKGHSWTLVGNGRQALVAVSQRDNDEVTGVAWYALDSDLRLTRLADGPGDPRLSDAYCTLGPTGIVALIGAQVMIGVVS